MNMNLMTLPHKWRLATFVDNVILIAKNIMEVEGMFREH